MHEEEVTKSILSAANGDEIARERLIKHYKAYIIHTVGHICKRYITWSDEESSIGLLAFNRAIDTYDIHADKSFLNYVYLLIKRSLIDHFRQEQKAMHIPLEVQADDDSTINVYEVEKSMESYQLSVRQNDLIEEINELREKLDDYGVRFEELENFSPKHRRTKRKLLKLADDVMQANDLVELFVQKKRLPATELINRYGHRRKTIERHRKYIVTLILLKLHPEWKQLSAYIEVPVGSEAKV
ncbi:sigma factor [Aquibacillus sediminis]|uniref:sigma factor n=1 Tax=Aquibacillus sediminis TaxID=2574734 RepID=UPI001109D065|nr:sigma factor [Aquibacillus sediminis]